jgi:hypothetical protein
METELPIKASAAPPPKADIVVELAGPADVSIEPSAPPLPSEAGTSVVTGPSVSLLSPKKDIEVELDGPGPSAEPSAPPLPAAAKTTAIQDDESLPPYSSC